MQKEKLQYLEGLRGLAALVVVLCHLSYAFAVHFTIDLLDTLHKYLNFEIIVYIIHINI